MTVSEVRQRYLDFFEKRGHTVIPSAPIVPENDPTTLFTSSGMQPLVPYLLGQPHPEGSRIVNAQKCFRAEDIEEVGDNRHTTFFEMLGNWSLGDYFKKEQLAWFFEFMTSKEEGLGLDPRRLYVTVFNGDTESNMSADTASVEIWEKLFSEKNIDAKYIELDTEENAAEVGMQQGRIFAYGAKKNWWSRAGIPTKMPAGEIGGPDSEVFYDFGTPHDTKFGKECHPNCDCGRFVEIGNSVFMQFIKQKDGTFAELPKKNVDFGGGLERLTAAANHNPDIFSIDVFNDARMETNEKTKLFERKNISPQEYAEEFTEAYRIVLDHIRAATFMLASNITPSNTEQGYVLRRLIRRAFLKSRRIGAGEKIFVDIAATYAKAYKNTYPRLTQNLEKIQNELCKENEQFSKTLAKAIKGLWKLFNDDSKDLSEKMNGQILFKFFTTEGFPPELILEQYNNYRKQEKLSLLTQPETDALIVDFKNKMKEHQKLSQAGATQKFTGGLADQSEQTIRYHTAHHLLLKALQIVLGPEVHQRGSNITSERLRIDFSYGKKMTPEQKEQVEKIVNEKIDEALPVLCTVMKKEEAEKLDAEHEFGAAYPDQVNVYSIGPKNATSQEPKISEAFSIEFCGGPHVTNTADLGIADAHFLIKKEEASSAGIRRIKAILK